MNRRGFLGSLMGLGAVLAAGPAAVTRLWQTIHPPSVHLIRGGFATNLLQADVTTTFARLAAVADGNVLRSGGVGAASLSGGASRDCVAGDILNARLREIYRQEMDRKFPTISDTLEHAVKGDTILVMPGAPSA